MQNTPDCCIRIQRKIEKSGMVYMRVFHELIIRLFCRSKLDSVYIYVCVCVCVCVCENNSRTYHMSVLPFEIGLCIYIRVFVCVCVCVEIFHQLIIRLFCHSK